MPTVPFKSTILVPRRAQMLPEFANKEIECTRRFGAARTYADGDLLFQTGKRGPGMYVVLAGKVRVMRHDDIKPDALNIKQGPGQFMGIGIQTAFFA